MRKIKGFNIMLGDKQYNLPTRLAQVNYRKGSELMTNLSLDIPDVIKHRKTLRDYLGCSDKELNTLSSEEISGVCNMLIDVCSKCENPVFNVININGQYYQLSALSDITVEQYIDMDYFFKESDNMLEVASQLMSILYKPMKVGFKGKILRRLKRYPIGENAFASMFVKMGNTEDVELDEVIFQQLNADILSRFFYYIIEYKQSLSEKYQIIFSDDTNEEDGNLDGEENALDPTKKFGYVKPVGQVWGWYDTLQSICDSKVSEVDKWYKKRVSEFMVFVSYTIQKNEEIKRNYKQQ